MGEWNNLVARFRDRCILVAGDVMLDEYVLGEVKRISPEAPVPVVELGKRLYAPGGAANVAAAVAGLGGHALVAGVTGRDFQAGLLRAAMEERNIDTGGLVVDGRRPTTSKTRIVARSQQIVRVDHELRAYLGHEMEEALLQRVRQRLPGVDACVLSDYGKGVVSPRLAGEVIRLATALGKPVVVDPKGRDYTRYRGAKVVTPNVHEVELALGCTLDNNHDLMAAGRRLLSELGGAALLITRGAEGMTLFSNEDRAIHVPSIARSVYDVTGAGDTVVAALALGLAAGAELKIAVRLANCAAGVVVGKPGTATLTVEELLAAAEIQVQNEPGCVLQKRAT